MKNTNKTQAILCKEGKCVDVSRINCTIAFKDIDSQIECEELKMSLVDEDYN